MVDPSEVEDQNKAHKGPLLDAPTVSSEAPWLPEDDRDVVATDEDGDAGFETPPTGSLEPSPCHTAAPASPESPAPPAEPKLHLDLYNFDSPAAEGSRYVLTSPRSLEACARCGIKPVELLPRPLAEFAREAPGRSVRVAVGLLEVFEGERQGKLRQCREERERIVREEKRRVLQAAANSSTIPSVGEQQHTVTSGSTHPTKAVPATSSSAPSAGVSCTGTVLAHTCKTPLSSTASPSSLSRSPDCVSSKTGPLSSVGSSHRSLQHGPAFSSVSGHVKASQSVSRPLPAARKSPGCKSANTFPRLSPRAPSFARANSTLSSVSKPALRSPIAAPSANGTATGPGFHQHNGHLGLHVRIQGKSHSLESLQRRTDSATTTTTTTTTCTSSESGASSSYSWEGPRDPWAKTSSPRGRTLATFNSLLGRSLSLGDLSHSPQTTQKVERIVREVKRRGLKAVPERDRKIAALMLARYQEEDIMSQTRYVAHLQWDSQRRMDELRRDAEERDKQRAVLECQRAWHSQVSSRQRRLSQRERECAAVRLRQAEKGEGRRRELAEQQERARVLRLQQAVRDEKQKKALQEHNLKALEEERAAILEQESLLLEEKLTTAELKRQVKEHRAQEERRGLNQAERRRHAALTREISRREEEEREGARRAAQEKLSRSLEKHERLVEQRDQELREKARREERQIQKARRAAKHREHQQRQQQEARAREAERRGQQAALVAEEKAREKAQRAVQSRQEKERLQRLNRQRVEDEERQRRLELLQSIERKLEKSEQIFKEKRAVLESARSVARASFHVRDRVREETNMRTFDKMALDAQLKAILDEK